MAPIILSWIRETASSTASDLGLRLRYSDSEDDDELLYRRSDCGLVVVSGNPLLVSREMECSGMVPEGVSLLDELLPLAYP